jgi:hypothetical protein
MKAIVNHCGREIVTKLPSKLLMRNKLQNSAMLTCSDNKVSIAVFKVNLIPGFVDGKLVTHTMARGRTC